MKVTKLLKPRPSTKSSRTNELNIESIIEGFDQLNASIERLEKHMNDMKKILDKLIDE